MDDPIQRHPTRAEQLDIMANAIAELARPGDRLLDLGCGTGYFIHLLGARLSHMRKSDFGITGVDMSETSLDAARHRFGSEGFEWIKADLGDPARLSLSHARYRFVTSTLVFHDLSDAQKQAMITHVAGLLEPDGVFLFYDRIRLTEPALYPLQVTLWHRLDHVYGAAMRSPETFAAYEHDLDGKNMPGRLADYQAWFESAGLAHAIMHLHGNIAVMAGALRG